jgi:hypothetical protein
MDLVGDAVALQEHRVPHDFLGYRAVHTAREAVHCCGGRRDAARRATRQRRSGVCVASGQDRAAGVILGHGPVGEWHWAKQGPFALALACSAYTGSKNILNCAVFSKDI